MKIKLLPSSFRMIGLVVFVIGFVSSYLYVYQNVKPDWLDIKVFAIYSSYLRNIYFGMTSTNIFDELAVTFMMVGLLFMSFSKTSTEKEYYQILRLKALIGAVVLQTLLVIFITWTFFGIAFMKLLMIQMITLLSFYLLLFKLLTLAARRSNTQSEELE